jgi:Zn-dependent metalloprotease
MNRLNKITATLAVILASASTTALAGNDFTVQNLTNAGTPSFVVGDLGNANAHETVAALKQLLATQSDYQARGNEGFSVSDQWVDTLGKRHTRLIQSINGIEVYGASMIDHADIEQKSASRQLTGDHTSATIYAVSGALAVNNESRPTLSLLLSKAQGGDRIAALAKELVK